MSGKNTIAFCHFCSSGIREGDSFSVEMEGEEAHYYHKACKLKLSKALSSVEDSEGCEKPSGLLLPAEGGTVEGIVESELIVFCHNVLRRAGMPLTPNSFFCSSEVLAGDLVKMIRGLNEEIGRLRWKVRWYEQELERAKQGELFSS